MNKRINISLRVMNSGDAEQVLDWENDPEVWQFSDDKGGYCLEDMKNLARSMRHYKKLGQLRYIIHDVSTKKMIGTVDLFQIDFAHAVAQVGILIADQSNRNIGYGSSALRLLEKKAHGLGIHCIQAEVDPQNHASLKLFEHLGYRRDHLSDVNPKKRIIFEKWLEE